MSYLTTAIQHCTGSSTYTIRQKKKKSQKSTKKSLGSKDQLYQVYGYKINVGKPFVTCTPEIQNSTLA